MASPRCTSLPEGSRTARQQGALAPDAGERRHLLGAGRRREAAQARSFPGRPAAPMACPAARRTSSSSLHGTNFALTRPTKLPVFDGALAIDHFAMANLGASNMEVAFKGAVEPISMQQLAKAFGWPEFSGTLAASIPGRHAQGQLLDVPGQRGIAGVRRHASSAATSASRIRSATSRNSSPTCARAISISDCVTQTFEVGSITGKLEVDVLGLELFAWSPVAFDARLATPKGDKSRHRISAKAVSSLSNVGGGGGGVVQALQSGVLRVLRRIQLRQARHHLPTARRRLRDVGRRARRRGYYIVKGAGLPRIDIVGKPGPRQLEAAACRRSRPRTSAGQRPCK